MMDMQALLADFLNNLDTITDDELLAEHEIAKKDSQDSFLLDGHEDSSIAFDDTYVSPVIAVPDTALFPDDKLVFIEINQTINPTKSATEVFARTTPLSTSYSYCSDFRTIIGAELWEKGSDVA